MNPQELPVLPGKKWLYHQLELFWLRLLGELYPVRCSDFPGQGPGLWVGLSDSLPRTHASVVLVWTRVSSLWA